MAGGRRLGAHRRLIAAGCGGTRLCRRFFVLRSPRFPVFRIEPRSRLPRQVADRLVGVSPSPSPAWCHDNHGRLLRISSAFSADSPSLPVFCRRARLNRRPIPRVEAALSGDRGKMREPCRLASAGDQPSARELCDDFTDSSLMSRCAACDWHGFHTSAEARRRRLTAWFGPGQPANALIAHADIAGSAEAVG